MKSLSAADMKNMNRKMVFDIVRREREVTRVGLGRATGMSGPSIVTIVDEFIESGILMPVGIEKAATPGRRSLKLRFNPDVMLSIGIEFEGDYLSIGVVNLDGGISCQMLSRIPSQFDDAFFEVILNSVERIENQLKKENKTYYGIGIGIPGAVDVNARTILFAPYVGVQSPLDISEMIHRMEERFGKPVYLENDVNACAIGEYYVRLCSRENDLLYVSIGAGLGAGLILNGKLRHGSHYLCGEIGYLVQSAENPVTRKQTGWLEGRVSNEVLEEKFGPMQPGGQVPRQVLDYIVNETAPFIANIVNTLDLSLVVLGGVLVRQFGENIAAVFEAALQKLTLFPTRVELCQSEFSGIVGAAMIASNKQSNAIL